RKGSLQERQHSWKEQAARWKQLGLRERSGPCQLRERCAIISHESHLSGHHLRNFHQAGPLRWLHPRRLP
ncbi:unnamed protein product, partial [Polarella glacialis]